MMYSKVQYIIQPLERTLANWLYFKARELSEYNHPYLFKSVIRITKLTT